MLLSQCFDFSDLGGVSDATGDPQLRHHFQEPSHRTSRFNAYDDRSRQSAIELSDRRPFVLQRSFDDFAGLVIEYRDRLLRCVQVAADNPHLGLLRPQRCTGGHRTVYWGRREADVVMTSFWTRSDRSTHVFARLFSSDAVRNLLVSRDEE